MKTERTHRLAAVLVLPLLLLVAGCDSGGGVAPPSETDWFKADCFRPAGAPEMMFKAIGSIEDEGTVAGNALPENAGEASWVVYRTLQGQQGELDLLVEAHSVTTASRVAEGHFTITGGSGAYAGHKGQGEFRAMVSDKEGLVEIFEGLLQ